MYNTITVGGETFIVVKNKYLDDEPMSHDYPLESYKMVFLTV